MSCPPGLRSRSKRVTMYYADFKGERMNLEGAVRQPYSRRAFILGAVSATTAGVLAACSQPSSAPAATAPAAAPTTAPATAKPAGAASPAASPAAAASP